MNLDMNRRLMYTSVKTVKAALTEVFVQSLNMEEWFKEMKTGFLIRKSKRNTSYGKIPWTYEAAFSRMRNNFWTDKIKKSHKIICRTFKTAPFLCVNFGLLWRLRGPSANIGLNRNFSPSGDKVVGFENGVRRFFLCYL